MFLTCHFVLSNTNLVDHYTLKYGIGTNDEMMFYVNLYEKEPQCLKLYIVRRITEKCT